MAGERAKKCVSEFGSRNVLVGLILHKLTKVVKTKLRPTLV